MYTSAMLKTEFSDGSGQWIHHFSNDISPPMLPIDAKPLSINDMVVATLLSKFFETSSGQQTNLEYTIPTMSLSPANMQSGILPHVVGMGSFVASTTNPLHGNTVSLVCFNEAALRASVSESFRVESPDTYERFQTIPIEDLPQLMAEFTPSGSTIKLIKNPKLTITRTTADELNMVAGQYDFPAFFDAFDLVKDRVARNESFLDGNSYAPAVYTPDGGDGSGDTIVFTGEYAMTVILGELAPIPL